jgi:hypothetical protein
MSQTMGLAGVHRQGTAEWEAQRDHRTALAAHRQENPQRRRVAVIARGRSLHGVVTMATSVCDGS